MYEIVYLPIAKQDITDIILYISDQLNAPKAAMDLLDAADSCQGNTRGRPENREVILKYRFLRQIQHPRV